VLGAKVMEAPGVHRRVMSGDSDPASSRPWSARLEVEEALVVAAIAASQPVHRAPSAPPAAVLGVRVADKVTRAA
jgi:hypothetical protein